MHSMVAHLDSSACHREFLRGIPEVQAISMDGKTVLLELCIGKQIISDIHAVLCARFDVAPERALDNLVTLVNQLTQEGLLQHERR